ncbi:MAG: DUF1343 domain-containing protein, partial [Gemmatimonadetes bacterium]|nr:DUF1343 domain-containing protein [Gemmatimonadota bacterium]
FRTGAQVLADGGFTLLQGKRVGLIANHTTKVGERHLADMLHQAEGVQLLELFAPEHGIRGTADAGAAVATETDPATGLVVHSLHGDTLKPTPEMLGDLDVLAFDLQDVGTRFYTYISTMGLAMQAAAEAGITFMVLDRPNPLGGKLGEGFSLELENKSFIGMYPIPATHGMTVGEVARMLKGERMLDGLVALDLVVVEMQGWTRDTMWPETGLPWIPPSPNIPDFETAVIYPGACFFGSVEGNEGRGTEHPFIQQGTVWGDGEALAAELNARALPGLRFEPIAYTPRSIPGMATNPRLEGREVRGIRHVVTDARAVRPVEAGVNVLHAFWHQAPDSLKATFFVDRPFRNVTGTARVSGMIVEGRTPAEIVAAWQPDVAAFLEMRRPYLLYE